MPSIEARLKAANAGSTTRTDRKSADAIFLSTANLTSELSRVNSTPFSSEAIDALTLQPSTSSTTDGSPNEPSPLTMAPPKPGPADTLYPSPSGGFVPSPEEGQDWRLKPPPPARRGNTAAANSSPSAAAGSSSSASASASASTASPPTKLRTLSSVAHVNNQRPTSCLGLTATCSTLTPARPPSLPCSNETAARIASASSSSLSRRNSQASNSLTSPQLRPTSSSASSRHRLGNASASAAAAAAEGNTDVASQHNQEASRADLKSSRPTSSASYQTARNADKPQDSPYAIEVRDFAFPPDDPRHHGEQLLDPEQEEVEQGSQDQYPQEESDAAEHEFYIEGADDENEFDGDEGDNANVPEGVYKVLYEFDPVSEHELAVQPGETVHVVGSIEGGWAIAIKDDDQAIKGLVPATYLEWTGPLPE
ncbi:uncharacterized protein UDID_08786 [Ustilago sp. UG-2017a]|nr:uncharacterized protein UDID_08786 [Ustilago sp. UG-2017a]